MAQIDRKKKDRGFFSPGRGRDNFFLPITGSDRGRANPASQDGKHSILNFFDILNQGDAAKILKLQSSENFAELSRKLNV